MNRKWIIVGVCGITILALGLGLGLGLQDEEQEIIKDDEIDIRNQWYTQYTYNMWHIYEIINISFYSEDFRLRKTTNGIVKGLIYNPEDPLSYNQLGKYDNNRTHDSTMFLGIPYASPPTGNYRWNIFVFQIPTIISLI